MRVRRTIFTVLCAVIAAGCNLNTQPPIFQVTTGPSPDTTSSTDVAGADAVTSDATTGDTGDEDVLADVVDDTTADDVADTGVPADTAAVDTLSVDTLVSIVDEGTFVGDALISAQADEATFASYTAIAGDLVVDVRSSEAIALPGLRTITGSIRLIGAADVEISGLLSLPDLETVGLNIEVAYVQEGAVLDFPELLFVGGHLDVSRGAIAIAAPKLSQVNGDLRFTDLEFRGFDLRALATIGGSVKIGRFSVGEELAALDLHFPALTALDGDFELWAGPDLRLAAPKLATIGGDFDVTRMAPDLDMPLLATVGGDVRLENLYLTALDVAALRTVLGEVRITSCAGPGLETLHLEKLSSVGGGLEILRLDDAVTIALDKLATLGGALRVAQVPTLEAVRAPLLLAVPTDVDLSWNGELVATLTALKTIGGDLDLQGNVSIDAKFNALESVAGNVLLTDTAIAGLTIGKLVEIGRHLRLITVESALPTVTFPLLHAVRGDVQVERLSSALTLALNALTSVGTTTEEDAFGSLLLLNNPDLASIGFALLTTVAVDVVVRGNPKLPRNVIDAYVGLMTAGGEKLLCGNKGDAACP